MPIFREIRPLEPCFLETRHFGTFWVAVQIANIQGPRCARVKYFFGQIYVKRPYLCMKFQVVSV